MASQGEEWSTDIVKAKIRHKWIRVRGWLLFDVEHIQNADHTNHGGKKIWRATVWEVHPITSIQLTTKPQ